jgi:anaerobic dimethyl sulfoxide reductase subunit B (iron-sulfur subunit)
VPAGSASWRRVITIEKGKYPKIFVAFLSLSCMHCAEPTCIPACPMGAISKREDDGIVVVDAETCLGNEGCKKFCRDCCPYDAPQFDTEDEAKMQMCNLCIDRWTAGKKPICVEACPTRALDAGPLDELREKYGDTKKIEGFNFIEDNKPSILFKAREPELL